MLEQMALNDTHIYPKIRITQLTVRSAFIYPLAEEAIMHLIPYSFFNFSTSQRLCSIIFCSQPNCYTRFFIQFFSNNIHCYIWNHMGSNTCFIECYNIDWSVWIIYSIPNLLTRNVHETISAIKRPGSFYAREVFLHNNKLCRFKNLKSHPLLVSNFSS